MPENIVTLIESEKLKADGGFLISYKGNQVKSVKKAWRNTRHKAGLDNRVNPYSLRHTMARWLRKEGVPAWEVAAQLGHKRQDVSTTEIYAPFDPSYLSKSVKAIDKFLSLLRVNAV